MDNADIIELMDLVFQERIRGMIESGALVLERSQAGAWDLQWQFYQAALKTDPFLFTVDVLLSTAGTSNKDPVWKKRITKSTQKDTNPVKESILLKCSKLEGVHANKGITGSGPASIFVEGKTKGVANDFWDRREKAIKIDSASKTPADDRRGKSSKGAFKQLITLLGVMVRLLTNPLPPYTPHSPTHHAHTAR